jgi:hypothetical protein
MDLSRTAFSGVIMSRDCSGGRCSIAPLVWLHRAGTSGVCQRTVLCLVNSNTGGNVEEKLGLCMSLGVSLVGWV